MNFLPFGTYARLFVLGLALSAFGASSARAQDDTRQSPPSSQQARSQTFQVNGVDPAQGPYSGQVTLTQRADGGVEVARDVLFDSGQREQQRGVGSQRGQEIRAQLRSDQAQGGLADLGGARQQGPVVARITAQVDPAAGTLQASVVDAQGQVSREQGALPATGQVSSTGQTAPATGQTLPDTLPATGQTLPATGQTLPAQTLPATGQTLPATGQVANSGGGTSQNLPAPSNQAGSTGQAANSTGQAGLPSGQLPPLGETLPSQGGVSSQSGQSGPTSQAPSAPGPAR